MNRMKWMKRGLAVGMAMVLGAAELTVLAEETFSPERAEGQTAAFVRANSVSGGDAAGNFASSDPAEIQEALKDEKITQIDYVMPQGQSVPQEEQREIFTSLQGGDKTFSFVFHNEVGKETYRWEFKGSDIEDAERTVEFQITIDANDPDVLEAVPEGVEQVDLRFLNEGMLPGRCNIKVLVDGYFQAEKLYLYYFNSTLGQLETVDGDVSFDGTYAAFYLDHNSNYILTASMLESLLPNRPTPPAEPDDDVDDDSDEKNDESGDANSSNGGDVDEALTDDTVIKGKDKGNAAILEHKVVRGDTLGKIAALYRTTIVRLLQLNPQIKNPNLIYVGQLLLVSEGADAQLSENDGYHIVQIGDSWYKIGRTYGIPVQTLQGLNAKLAAQKYLYRGQKIILRPEDLDR